MLSLRNYVHGEKEAIMRKRSDQIHSSAFGMVSLVFQQTKPTILSNCQWLAKRFVRIAGECDYWACSASAIGIPMSMAFTFDTLRAAKQLQKSGFAQPQAEAIINIISDKHEHLATKSDLETLRIDLETIKEATKAEFKNPR